MHSTEKSQNDMPMTNWDHCPPGELQRLVGRLNVLERCAKRKQFCYRGAGVLSMAAVLIVSISTLMPNPTSYGGLTCQQCQSHFDAFHSHLTSEVNDHVATVEEDRSDVMDSALAEKIKAHLANCDRCRSQFKSVHPDSLTGLRMTGLRLAGLQTGNLGQWVSANTILQARILFAVVGSTESYNFLVR
jgi:hypothetical protein